MSAGLALTACGPDDESSSGSQDDSATEETQSNSGDNADGGEGQDSGELSHEVRLLRTGSSDTAELTVDIDGEWSYEHKKTQETDSGQLDADVVSDLDELEQRSELSDWGGLEKEPDDTDMCGDVDIYVLTVGDTTVKNNGCGDDPNEAYTEIVELLQEETPI